MYLAVFSPLSSKYSTVVPVPPKPEDVVSTIPDLISYGPFAANVATQDVQSSFSILPFGYIGIFALVQSPQNKNKDEKSR
jgi:hypothetical protein